MEGRPWGAHLNETGRSAGRERRTPFCTGSSAAPRETLRLGEDPRGAVASSSAERTTAVPAARTLQREVLSLRAPAGTPKPTHWLRTLGPQHWEPRALS